MPSPDLSDLVDLTLYDADPDSLVARALVDITTKLPELTPTAGNLEVILLEALSTPVAELIYSVNRLPGAVLDCLLQLYGITRDPGTYPTTTVTFTTAASGGLQIPAGSVVRLNITGDDPLDFATDSEAVSTGTTVTTTVTALELTARANGTASGTPLDVVSVIPTVDSAQLASTVTGGLDPEDEDSWRLRAVQRLDRLVTTLVTPAHFTAEALETVGVYRAITLDNNNAGTTAAGHVTVAVYGQGGVALSSPAKTALQADLTAKAQVNLAVHVVDPTVTAVAVTATVHPLPGYTSSDVQANVTAALDAYLSPDTWPWSGTVRRNELISVIDRAEGVEYVTTLAAPSADVTLSGTATLANLGTTTITVT